MSDPISLPLIFLKKIVIAIGSKITVDILLPPMKNYWPKINPFNQSKGVIAFDLSTTEQRKLFYQKVKDLYANASKDIYVISTGRRPADEDESLLLPGQGLRQALIKGVKVCKFQTIDSYSEEWIKTYISLTRDYPNSIKIYEDFENSPMISTALIDPDTNPILIETRQTSRYEGDNAITVLALGLFIYDQKDLAQAFKNQLLERKKHLKLMTFNDRED
jgi:hypothetical protein